jgi:type I restriction enzyme, S subunit
MTTEWRNIRVGDIASFNKLSINRNFEHKIIEYIDTSSVFKGNLIDTQILKLKEAPSRAKRLIRKNDILISSVRPNLEHYYFVRNCQENTVVSTGFIVITPGNKVDPYFLYCLLTTKKYTKYLTRIANSHTSTYPSFNPEVIENSYLLMPEKTEQEKISDCLFSLDKKIDLLRRQNETLEQIAQTLFKRWFVDFEFPDENGQPYKSSGGKMVPSELGEIPENWHSGKIHDICYILNETMSPNVFKDKLFIYYSIPAFDEGMFPVRELGKNILSNKFYVRPYSILVSKLNPRITRIWPVFEIDYKKSICSTEFQVIKPKKMKYFAFIYYLFRTYFIKKEMMKRTTGTSGSHQRIRPDDIIDIDISLPSEKVVKEFGNIVISLMDKIKSNLESIMNLGAIRDTLLPKLMSGKIRINDK